MFDLSALIGLILFLAVITICILNLTVFADVDEITIVEYELTESNNKTITFNIGG